MDVIGYALAQQLPTTEVTDNSTVAGSTSALPATPTYPGITVKGGYLYLIRGTLNPSLAYRYDLAAGTWTNLPNLPVVVDNSRPLTGSLADGLVYAMGGRGSAAYDPTAGTWTTKATVPLGTGSATRANLVGVVDNQGRMHALGGTVSGAEQTYHGIYTPATNTWTTGAAMTAARQDGAGGTSQAGAIVHYFGGGLGGYNNVKADHIAYDVAGDTWTTKAPLAVAMDYLGGATVDAVGGGTHILALGGRDNLNQSYNGVRRYDLAANTWANISGTLPAALYYLDAVGVAGDAYAVADGDPTLYKRPYSKLSANAQAPLIQTLRAYLAAK